MSHSIVKVYVHVVFSTKRRIPLLSPELEEDLFPYMVGVARKMKTHVLAINGTPDHVHLLLKMPATEPLARVVGAIKANSSGKAKALGESRFDWQDGYGAFSCSIGHVDKVIGYIQNQKEHHRTHSFDDEMERYASIWDFTWISASTEPLR